MLGLLAIAAAVYLTRRCLTQHRSAPEPGFEVDTSNLDEVEPFVSPTMMSTPLLSPPGTGAVGAAEEWRNTKSHLRQSLLRPFSATGDASTPVHRPTADGGASPSPETSASASARPSAVVHEEDAEDAELGLVLPPMYREAWAQRRSMEPRDGAVGVTRAKEGFVEVDLDTLLLDKSETGGPATRAWSFVDPAAGGVSALGREVESE